MSYHTGIFKNQHIQKGAKLYRDSKGIPHIDAETINDAMFSLGFVHAEDRLWQMFLDYKIAAGEISKTFNHDLVFIDKFTRFFKFRQVCEAVTSRFTELENKRWKAYANGVNYYVENTWILPFEFYLTNNKPVKWSKIEGCMVAKVVEFMLTFNFVQEGIKTYLKEKLNINSEIIRKLYPTIISDFEYQTTIVKEGEMNYSKFKGVNTTNKGSNTKDNKDSDNTNTQEYKEKGKVNSLSSSSSKENQTELDPHIYDTIREVLTPAGGSDNCIISGKHTKSGFPIICNDPHLLNQIPSFWYLSVTKIKESDYIITGASHPGTPCNFIGSNGYLMWGITNGLVDTSDILRLKKVSDSSHLLDNKEHKLAKRIERIYKSKKPTDYIDFEYLEHEEGPIMNGLFFDIMKTLKQGKIGVNMDFVNLNGDEKYFHLLKSPLVSIQDGTLQAMSFFHLAKTTKELKDLLSRIGITLNVVFADKHNNIFYNLTGTVPKRDINKNDLVSDIILYSKDLYNREYIDFEELPNLTNPKRGYIVSANNICISKDYPYRIQGSWYTDSRAVALEKAIKKLIKNGTQKVDLESINKECINNIEDVYAVPLINLVKDIAHDDISLNLNADYLKMLNFDGINTRDNYNGLLFNVFETELIWSLFISKEINSNQEIHRSVLATHQLDNFLFYKLKKYKNNKKICNYEYNMSCSLFIKGVFEKTINFLTLNLGKDSNKWRWDTLNVKHFPHKPYSMVPGLKYLGHRVVKANGNKRTVKISNFFLHKRTYNCHINSNLKMLISHNQPNNSTYFSIDTGMSGKAIHPHYDDMVESHEKGELMLLYDEEFYSNKKKYSLEFRNKPAKKK